MTDKELIERLRVQKTVDEMDPDEMDRADFIYGHQMCVLDGRYAADRIEALNAEVEKWRNQAAKDQSYIQDVCVPAIARLREALREMFEVVCGETGFAQAVRAESGIAYPWPALDMAEAKARAALAGDKP